MSGTILVDDELRKAKTDNMLTETIDGERTIRRAERFFIDSNMILNLRFCQLYLYDKTLPSASLVSADKGQKAPAKTFGFP